MNMNMFSLDVFIWTGYREFEIKYIQKQLFFSLNINQNVDKDIGNSFYLTRVGIGGYRQPC